MEGSSHEHMSSCCMSAACQKAAFLHCFKAQSCNDHHASHWALTSCPWKLLCFFFLLGAKDNGVDHMWAFAFLHVSVVCDKIAFSLWLQWTCTKIAKVINPVTACWPSGHESCLTLALCSCVLQKMKETKHEHLLLCLILAFCWVEKIMVESRCEHLVACTPSLHIKKLSFHSASRLKVAKVIVTNACFVSHQCCILQGHLFTAPSAAPSLQESWRFSLSIGTRKNSSNITLDTLMAMKANEGSCKGKKRQKNGWFNHRFRGRKQQKLWGLGCRRGGFWHFE